MKELYIDSNNNSCNFPKFYRRMQEVLKKEQKILSRRKRNSTRYKKQKVKIAKIHEKISNQRRDFLHKQSHLLATQYNLVCTEDLNMQDISKCLKFGKSVYDNSWGLFTNCLQYKLQEQGKVLFKIDRWYPSSKTYNVCGFINKTLQLSDRIWKCNCNEILLRDYNAAINIRNFGINKIRTEGTSELAQ